MALFVPIAALSQLKDIAFIPKLFAKEALALGRNSGKRKYLVRARGLSNVHERLLGLTLR